MSKYKIIITLILFCLFQTTPSISLELKIPKIGDLEKITEDIEKEIEKKEPEVKKEEVKKEEVKKEGILIFDCKQLRETQTPKDYIKYEIDTDTQTFRQIFKLSNRDEPIIEKNVANGGLINSTFYPPYGFIYEYTDSKKYNYRFDYGPGDEFIDHEWLGSVKSTPSMKCTREK